jgi:hypothetical protein
MFDFFSVLFTKGLFIDLVNQILKFLAIRINII